MSLHGAKTQQHHTGNGFKTSMEDVGVCFEDMNRIDVAQDVVH
jgi:hypothetical protein